MPAPLTMRVSVSAIHSSIRNLAVAALTGLLLGQGAVAIDYTAVADGDWDNASTWSPAGVPGAGDRVVSMGANNVSVRGAEQIGDGTETVAINVDDIGALIIEPGASLTVAGHLNHSGWRGEIIIRAGAALLFDAAAGQQLEFQANNANQKLTFDGAPSNRGRLGLAAGAAGGWHIEAAGFRDSRINGSYGIISDSFNPLNDRGWFMSMANEPGDSEFVADHIEFLRCGEISIFGFDAGEFTRVELDALTFRAQAKSGALYTRPAFWFDGFGGETADSGPSQVPKSLTNIVSETQINLRYVAGYTLDHFVLGPDGAGNARDGNNAGNAASHNNVFMSTNAGGAATSLLADETRNVYFYTSANNPHGFDTRQLRGDALLSNFWFESAFLGQTDTGDAVLTNGPQYYVDTYGGDVPTLTISDSGTIGDSSGEARHPTLFTFNNGEGIRVAVRHSVALVGINAQAIALDENGATPTGAGVEFIDSIVYAELPDYGYALGSTDTAVSAGVDNFLRVDNNLYFNLKSDGADGALGVHTAQFSSAPDAASRVVDPLLLDDSRNLASWDAHLGGPGTAAHAIAEMMKRNDDSGFNPAYTVQALTRYVAEGHSTTRNDAIASDGLPIGPSLFEVPLVDPNGAGDPISVDLTGYGVAAQDNARGTGYIMYSPTNLFSRFASRPPFANNFRNFIAVRYGSGRWFYDDNNRYRPFTPADGDILVAAVDFTADTVTSLEGVDTQTLGIQTGYAEGDLVYAANQWNFPNFAFGEFDIDGTFFTPWADVTPPGNASLQNGGLEAGITGGTIDFLETLPGWQSVNFVEVWGSGFNGVNSTDGGNFVELDNAGGGIADRIWQNVDTDAGQVYRLSFSMRARGSNVRSADEAICVEFNGVKVRENCYSATRAGAWTTHTALVVGTGGSDEIAFREALNTGASDGTGPFLDNVAFEPLEDALLYREMERAELRGNFRIGLDGSAANGAYAHVPNGFGNFYNSLSGNYMDVDYHVTEAGDYALEGGFSARSSNDNSFWVVVNGLDAAAYLWDGPSNTSGYVPTFVSDRGVTSKVVVTLQPGIHRVRVYQREDGTRLDWLRLVAQ